MTSNQNLASHLAKVLILSNQLISVKERIELMKEFEESNQKVAKEYLARTNGQLFDSSPIS